MKYLLAILFILNSSWLLASSKLIPFTTDYCTGYPEGTLAQPGLWSKCCVEHDLYLWAGGSKNDRKQTDQRLRKCVAATGASLHSQLIYLGVRLGSYSPLKFKGKDWGNGWNPRRSNFALSQSEILTIEEFLKDNPPSALSNLEVDGLIANLKNRKERQ